MKELNIGVIGVGGRGKLARHAHRPGAGSRIAAICDTNPLMLEEGKSRYGDDVIATPDYREMLEADLDAVFICSPDFMHEEHAVAAFEKKLAVFLEKPMAITLAGCDRILQMDSGNRLFVGHNMRYMNIIRKMKQLVDNGEIGQVKAIWCRHFISYGGDAYFRDWHADRRRSTGLLLQKGAHDIDVIHYLAGGYTRRVSAFGNLSVYDQLPRLAEGQQGPVAFEKTHWPPMQQTGFYNVIDVEDQNIVNMELEGGVLATYMQCHFTPDSCRNYTVIGTEGRLENLGDKPDSPIFVWNRRSDTYNMIGDKVFRGDPAGSSSHGGADELIVDDFLHFVRGDTSRGATPVAARMAVAAGYLATQSLRERGKPYDVPPVQIRSTAATV